MVVVLLSWARNLSRVRQRTRRARDACLRPKFPAKQPIAPFCSKLKYANTNTVSERISAINFLLISSITHPPHNNLENLLWRIFSHCVCVRCCNGKSGSLAISSTQVMISEQSNTDLHEGRFGTKCSRITLIWTSFTFVARHCVRSGADCSSTGSIILTMAWDLDVEHCKR